MINNKTRNLSLFNMQPDWCEGGNGIGHHAFYSFIHVYWGHWGLNYASVEVSWFYIDRLLSRCTEFSRNTKSSL